MSGTRSTQRRDEKYDILVGKHHFEDLGVDGRIILERILGKYGGNMWTGFICLWIEASGGLLGTL
jgi:hypothetical protein